MDPNPIYLLPLYTSLYYHCPLTLPTFCSFLASPFIPCLSSCSPSRYPKAVHLSLVLDRRPKDAPNLPKLNKWQHRQCAECR